MPFWPVMGDGVDATRRQSYLSGRGGDLLDHARVDGRVADDALAHLVAAGLELRLDQRDDVGAGPKHRRDDGKDVAQRDERDVDRHDVDRAGQIGERQVPRVEVLDDDDARVVAQPQSSWPWPTSSATTRAAPRCSSTSVKPPVEAPMSSASRPRDRDAETCRARARA